MTDDMIKVSDDIWGIGLVFDVEKILLPSGGDGNVDTEKEHQPDETFALEIQAM